MDNLVELGRETVHVDLAKIGVQGGIIAQPPGAKGVRIQPHVCHWGQPAAVLLAVVGGSGPGTQELSSGSEHALPKAIGLDEGGNASVHMEVVKAGVELADRGARFVVVWLGTAEALDRIIDAERAADKKKGASAPAAEAPRAVRRGKSKE